MKNDKIENLCLRRFGPFQSSISLSDIPSIRYSLDTLFHDALRIADF